MNEKTNVIKVYNKTCKAKCDELKRKYSKDDLLKSVDRLYDNDKEISENSEQIDKDVMSVVDELYRLFEYSLKDSDNFDDDMILFNDMLNEFNTTQAKNA